MDDAQASVLQDFMAITGVEDITAATSILDATNWVLEEAVNLQFATGGDLGGAGPNHRAATTAGAQAAPDIPPHLLEEEVRAPLPVVRDRLYGDAPGPHGVPVRPARYGAPPDRGPTHVDVFKDFGPSAEAGGSSGAAAGGSSRAATAAAAGPSAAGAPKLSDLFKPPAGLLFAGNWEDAVAHAAKQGRWLLVNVQSADEFATHRLNRDTWGDSLVQDMIKGTFVFWQCYSTADQGQALTRQYQLEQLPACLIVDPITRAKLWERYGFISSEALVEELVPYMDCGPTDPGASDLAHRAYQQSAKRRHKAAAGPGSTGGGDTAAMMSEEDQLALALAMSVEQQPAAGGPGPAAGDESDDDMDDLDEEAIWQEVQRRQREQEAAKAAPAARGPASTAAAAPTAAAAAARLPSPAAPTAAAPPAPPAAGAVDVAAVQAAAAARLPPEPADGAADTCRVAFRLPDGSRVQRRFNSTDTVAALQDYCISMSADAASMASFQLSEARPGAQPLSDPAATIAAAGVANAMLVLKSVS